AYEIFTWLEFRRVLFRSVDPQRGVGKQAVAVEALDVVALEGRPVAPDLDVVGLHRTHEERARHSPAERRGVEVGPAAAADVEREIGRASCREGGGVERGG